MTQIISFEDFIPPPRFDGVPFTLARIEESATIDGSYTAIETVPISPVDTDPAVPLSRSFTTTLASDTPRLWYRIVFLDASNAETLPTAPTQNGVIASYATVDELALLLRVKVSDRRNALYRVLEAAAYEVNAEIDGPRDLTAAELQVAAEVNLERAVEHWQQGQSPFGIIGLGSDVPMAAASDSWNRHAHKLAPLKQSWGFA